MQPVNSQLFYYVLFVYAIGMAAYIALPIRPAVVIAESPISASPAVMSPVHSAASAVEATAHPVSLEEKPGTPALLTTPQDAAPGPTVLRDDHQSL